MLSYSIMRLLGSGHALGETLIKNDDPLFGRLGVSPEAIHRLTGITQRYYFKETAAAGKEGRTFEGRSRKLEVKTRRAPSESKCKMLNRKLKKYNNHQCQ